MLSKKTINTKQQTNVRKHSQLKEIGTKTAVKWSLKFTLKERMLSAPSLSQGLSNPQMKNAKARAQNLESTSPQNQRRKNDKQAKV